MIERSSHEVIGGSTSGYGYSYDNDLKISCESTWGNSEVGDQPEKDTTCLMEIKPPEVYPNSSVSNLYELQKDNVELLQFCKDFVKTNQRLLKQRHYLKNEQIKLHNKINELELEVRKLTKSKEVIEPCQKYELLTQNIDSLEGNVSKLQEEALSFSKFKKSGSILDDMLCHQELSQDKEGLGFSKAKKTTSESSKSCGRIAWGVIVEMNGQMGNLSSELTSQGYGECGRDNMTRSDLEYVGGSSIARRICLAETDRRDSGVILERMGCQRSIRLRCGEDVITREPGECEACGESSSILSVGISSISAREQRSVEVSGRGAIVRRVVDALSERSSDSTFRSMGLKTAIARRECGMSQRFVISQLRRIVARCARSGSSYAHRLNTLLEDTHTSLALSYAYEGGIATLSRSMSMSSILEQFVAPLWGASRAAAARCSRHLGSADEAMVGDRLWRRARGGCRLCGHLHRDHGSLRAQAASAFRRESSTRSAQRPRGAKASVSSSRAGWEAL
ncbi:hypothetical protein Tco_0196046 [Tanacetum coccineum]